MAGSLEPLDRNIFLNILGATAKSDHRNLFPQELRANSRLEQVLSPGPVFIIISWNLEVTGLKATLSIAVVFFLKKTAKYVQDTYLQSDLTFHLLTQYFVYCCDNTG